jgi:hypothetical protein
MPDFTPDAIDHGRTEVSLESSGPLEIENFYSLERLNEGVLDNVVCVG